MRPEKTGGPGWPAAFGSEWRHLVGEQRESRLLQPDQLVTGDPDQLLEDKQVQRDPTQREEDTEDLTWDCTGRQVPVACNTTHSQQGGATHGSGRWKEVEEKEEQEPMEK